MLQNLFFQPILTAFLNVNKSSVKSLSFLLLCLHTIFYLRQHKMTKYEAKISTGYFQLRSSHYFFNLTKMRQLIARQSVKQFDTQNVKNWQQWIIFWFNWHNTLISLRIIYKINIFNNKPIISLQFLYACHFKYIAWQMKSPTISIKLSTYINSL